MYWTDGVAFRGGDGVRGGEVITVENPYRKLTSAYKVEYDELTKAPEGVTQQLAEIKSQGGSEEDLMTDEQLAQIRAEEEEALKNTIVYSVYNGAIRYHKSKICGTQTNGRQLTVEQAMSEGLAVCPNCNPPVWTG